MPTPVPQSVKFSDAAVKLERSASSIARRAIATIADVDYEEFVTGTQPQRGITKDLVQGENPTDVA